MRLWTYQKKEWLNTLQVDNIIYGNWNCVWHLDIKKYQWMVKQMQVCQIPILSSHTPIWCWHSYGNYGHAADNLTANMLLSHYDIEQGIQLITLEVPDELVLLSDYHQWCNIYYANHFDQKNMTAKKTRNIFNITHEKYPKDGLYIQATLPYDLSDWIVETSSLLDKSIFD